MVPIRRVDGTYVTEFVSAPTWQDLKRGKDTPQPIDPTPILAEEHHNAYGRPWFFGRCYFDHLMRCNIQPQDNVLDLGCGAGRLGVWLIPFLEAGRYYGVDHHLGTLVAFAGYESALHALFDKRPNLLLDDDFRVECFGVKFDVVLDSHVSAHIEMSARERMFRRLTSTLAPGARLFFSHKPKLRKTLLPELGFERVSVEEIDYPFVEGLPATYQTRDRWYEFRFRP